MELKYVLNGRKTAASVEADTSLYEELRRQGCYSVKCACETTNCGLCTVWVDGVPMLSCAIPALRIEGKEITTLEGVQEEAKEFAAFMAKEGADQCGFCNPGFVMSVLALRRDLENPTDEEIQAYLSGNLCRCTGYTGHLRAIRGFLAARKGEKL